MGICGAYVRASSVLLVGKKSIFGRFSDRRILGKRDFLQDAVAKVRFSLLIVTVDRRVRVLQKELRKNCERKVVLIDVKVGGENFFRLKNCNLGRTGSLYTRHTMIVNRTICMGNDRVMGKG